MLNSPLDSPGGPDAKPEDVERIVQEGPHGAIVVAGIATFVVVALWLAFYFLVFVPRGAA